MPRLTEAEAYQIAGECLHPLSDQEPMGVRMQRVADRIVAALLGAKKPPAWTTDPPTTEGWWWYRDEWEGTVPLYHSACDFDLLHVDMCTGQDQELLGVPITELKGEWAPMDGPPPREG